MKIDAPTRARVVEMLRSDATIAAVSRATGVKPPSVSAIAREEGIPRRRGVPKGTRFAFGKIDKRKLAALVERCASIGEMRAAFNVSKQAIYQAIARWGLR